MLLQQGEDAAEANYKVSWEKLGYYWQHRCMVIVRNRAVTDCTCHMSRNRGHCVHEYAVQELEGIRKYRGFPVPSASAGQQALRKRIAPEDAGSSCDEDGPNRPTRRRTNVALQKQAVNEGSSSVVKRRKIK